MAVLWDFFLKGKNGFHYSSRKRQGKKNARHGKHFNGLRPRKWHYWSFQSGRISHMGSLTSPCCRPFFVLWAVIVWSANGHYWRVRTELAVKKVDKSPQSWDIPPVPWLEWLRTNSWTELGLRFIFITFFAFCLSHRAPMTSCIPKTLVWHVSTVRLANFKDQKK